MPRTTSDYFDPLADALAVAGVHHSPAELHGVICGLLSTGLGSQDAELLGVLAAHSELEGGWSAEASGGLLAVRDLAQEAYAGEGMELVLLLPEDDEELGTRVAALAQWCEGFLVGFGTGSAGKRDADLPQGLQEALSDIAAISQVGVPEDNGEEEERMFEQVAEHARMAAMMVFTELALAAERAAPAKVTPPPVQH